jgi:hypothetical protein
VRINDLYAYYAKNNETYMYTMFNGGSLSASFGMIALGPRTRQRGPTSMGAICFLTLVEDITMLDGGEGFGL